MKKQSTSKAIRKYVQREMAVDGALHLPVINTNLTTRRRMRFSGTVASILYATARTLLDTQLVATDATHLYDLYDFVRVLEIEAWAYGTSASAIPSPVNATIVFPGNVQGALSADARQLTDSSLGMVPAHVKARPPRGSLASTWQVSTSVSPPVMFGVQCNRSDLGATTWTVDVVLEFRTVESFAPTPAQNLGVGLTVGQWFYRGFDGLPLATTNALPQGVTNIA